MLRCNRNIGVAYKNKPICYHRLKRVNGGIRTGQLRFKSRVRIFIVLPAICSTDSRPNRLQIVIFNSYVIVITKYYVFIIGTYTHIPRSIV